MPRPHSIETDWSSDEGRSSHETYPTDDAYDEGHVEYEYDVYGDAEGDTPRTVEVGFASDDDYSLEASRPSPSPPRETERRRERERRKERQAERDRGETGSSAGTRSSGTRSSGTRSENRNERRSNERRGENPPPILRNPYNDEEMGTQVEQSKRTVVSLASYGHELPKRQSRRTRLSKKEEERNRRMSSAASKMSSRGVPMRQRPKKYAPPLPEPKGDFAPTCGTRCWDAWVCFMTFLIPDFLVPREGKSAKRAWREKIAIFDILVLSNAFFLIVFGIVPLFFCRDDIADVGINDYGWYDNVKGPVCKGLNLGMYILLFLAAILLGLQCLCSMFAIIQNLLYKWNWIRSNEEEIESVQGNAVMVMVPCYNEGELELKKTINSILYTDYPDENKLLVVVADGIITGRGEFMNTPKFLADILGFRVRKRDPAYPYKSNGSSRDNNASVYHGTYTKNKRSLKYIVIVKRGTGSEKNSSRPGNRGKRDSQLIALGLFNRVHYDRELCPLDLAVTQAMVELEIPATDVKYMLAIDADTRISEGSICQMVYAMEEDDKILACCGETRVDNKAEGWVTMIQVFEYFASHHLKKSFESYFGCVTCLPGCFTMYRMYNEDWRPLLSADNIYQPYNRNDIESLHEKNLYHLGEDRMLTTLLLKYHHRMKLSFVTSALCWTIVPNSFKVLLSQRRRWINSTVHNIVELLKVDTMCGCCCISMKSIVFLDLISTMILPAAVVYALSFVYMVIFQGEAFSVVTLGLYGAILGAQLLIFLARGRIDYFWWYLIYMVLGVPVFYFILPIYSFWHMDDFSWGQTRQVVEKEEEKKQEGGADTFKDEPIMSA